MTPFFYNLSSELLLYTPIDITINLFLKSVNSSDHILLIFFYFPSIHCIIKATRRWTRERRKCMKKYNMKILSLRIVSVFLACFAIIFGGSWNKTGFCLGDSLFTSLGLPIWSDGISGTHYPAVIGIVLLFLSFFLFAYTTEHKARTLRLIFVCFFLLLVILNLIVSLF